MAIAVLLCLYFGNMFVLSIFETIGLPLTMDEFSWSPAEVREGWDCVAVVPPSLRNLFLTLFHLF